MSMDMNVNMNMGQTALNVSFGNGGNAQPAPAPTPPAPTQQPEPAPATQEVQIVYVEGYSGAIGCEKPVDDSRFERMMDKIADAGFSDDQVAMAKQILRTNCLKISQLVEILEEIAFDEGQLELAKFAYDHIYDLENYWEVYGVFSFSSSLKRWSNSSTASTENERLVAAGRIHASRPIWTQNRVFGVPLEVSLALLATTL